MTQEELIEVLKDEESKLHKDLLRTSMALLKTSKDHMSKYYAGWDAADMACRVQRKPDEQDRKSELRNEPVKQILPFVRAQVDTFVAFCIMLYNQRDRFYGLDGSGPEDQAQPTAPGTDPLTGQMLPPELSFSPERDAETVLARDTKKNKWSALQYQVLFDIGRFGIGVTKHTWDTRSADVVKNVQVEQPPTVLNMEGTTVTQTSTVRQTVYEGNKVVVISPYRFFPDTRLPITRLQDGEFCASEDELSIQQLKRMEKEGLVFGVEELKDHKLDTELLEISRFRSFGEDDSTLQSLSSEETTPGMAVVSEIQRWLVPAEFKVSDEEGAETLGPETYPVLYVIGIGNWKKIIRCEPLNYSHNEFTYDAAQLSADQHEAMNEGLAELLGPMQDAASWFLNSRIAAVKKIIDSRLVVHPSMIEMKDLAERKPVIRATANAVGSLDMWVKQLQVQDTTQNHVQDIQVLWSFMQTATGITENALGQYTGGRRSAQESRAVNAGAAARLKVIASVIWETLFEPLGSKMLCNLQSEISFEEFKRVVGDDASEARFLAFNKRDKGVLNSYDFNIFDGTMPSEKGYTAQTMQELFLGLLSNPATAQMLQTEPFRSLFVEIAELRSIRNPSRFLPPPLPAGAAPVVLPGPSTNDLSTSNTGETDGGATAGVA